MSFEIPEHVVSLRKRVRRFIPDEVHKVTVARLLLREYGHGRRWDFAEHG